MTAKPGTLVRAVVVAPYEIDGNVVIPAGSIVRGHVKAVKPVGFGLKRERASLDLQFRECRTPDGQSFPLHATLISVDNAREQVTVEGRIKGILAARNPNGLFAGVWEKPSPNLFFRSLIGLTGTSNQIYLKFAMGPASAAAIFALRCAVLPFPEPEIDLPPGTEMQLAITIRPGEVVPSVKRDSSVAASDLADWLRSKSRKVTDVHGRKAADVTNIAFLGPRSNLINAFSLAGWSSADPATVHSISHMYAAFINMRDYSSAPVSKLLYGGAEPDLVFEKTLNTISKRHHIRIWYGGAFNGEDVWLGAATHDTGIAFRPASMRFTHTIDRAIDEERSKIVNDLEFAGCTERASYLEPISTATHLNSEKGIVTDARIAVIPVTTCADNVDANDDSSIRGPHASKIRRFTRRVVLEARYYIQRENAYYWTYEFFKWRHLQASRANQTTDSN